MDKHRLELFSDGVFAIVLTILVLELKPPTLDGLAGVRQIAPMLLIHALTFAWLGLFWLFHYRILTGIRIVTLRTQAANLVMLFWMTLVPFGSVLAAEHPQEPLGASIMAIAGAGWSFASFAMNALAAMAGEAPTPAQQQYILTQRRFPLVSGILYTLVAAMCWVTPWFGYVWMVLALLVFIWALRMPLPSVELERLRALDLAGGPSGS
jgi:uncharacterized membrane protein